MLPRYVGGPFDGQGYAGSAPYPRLDSTGDPTYVYLFEADGNYHWVRRDAVPAAPGDTTAFPSEKQLYLAWSRLQRQYGVGRMMAIRRSAAARARIRRGVR